MNTTPLRHQSATIATAIVLLLAQAGAHAQASFDEEFDDTGKTWQEIAVHLPSMPDMAKLIPFDVSATATQTFSVAPETLTVGADGVIRYVMVARSSSDALNISYQGLRCASLEKKLYAFGRPDGTWSRSRNDAWEPIGGNLANRRHAALAQDYFCDGSTVAGKASDIVRRMKSGQSIIKHFSQ
ncbi:CNP1-like family protein [Actimicrobium sp. CCI2.3]|uniref:CNP1-like family protein n=1 Tax=Actimicrobium sp. CCI2.3 TaxID=3048616 RepID=UPI002AB44C8F|nr:CNP1-like family protein [Actimicrobium sp. CCI2.3]MDY7573571.1 CNP1-like family protein [Actimicrobium sp. CCI2.3]MEB0022084.1 CNP1-like family protein [Actimicrobium sp. CCI2.3]